MSSDAQDERRHVKESDDHKHRRKKNSKDDKQQYADMRGDPRYAGQSGHQRGSVPSQNVGGGSAMYNSSGFKSGHMEVNSLYSGDSGAIKVNAMNAPNNSTLQCGCENIECPFCNQMLSIQMSGH